jgi:hypothetical protein
MPRIGCACRLRAAVAGNRYRDGNFRIVCRAMLRDNAAA